jgi:hypothetical protein
MNLSICGYPILPNNINNDHHNSSIIAPEPSGGKGYLYLNADEDQRFIYYNI